MILDELTTPRPADRRIELHVRTDLPSPDRFEAVRERLSALDETGRIGDAEVSTWPEQATLSSERPGIDVVDAYERFESWASKRGVSINPPFVVQTGTRTVVGEEYSVLRTPTMCLAAYDLDRLVGVFPCVDGETAYTIEDALSVLEEATSKRPATDNTRVSTEF